MSGFPFPLTLLVSPAYAFISQMDSSQLKSLQAPLKQKYQDVPLVADVHHQGSDIAVEVARYVDKVRINPGLFVFRKRVQRTLEYSESEIHEELEAIEQELAPLLDGEDVSERVTR